MPFHVFDATSVLACLALFGGTFVQEGVALGAGAILIIRGDVSPILTGLSLFTGFVCGDCCIYGLGALARQSTWAKGLIAGVDLKAAEAWLNKHLFITIAMSHLVPWLLFPTFVALGWSGVPFKRFAPMSAFFSALYIPAALLVLTAAGGAVWPYLSDKIWILWLVAGVIITALIVLRWRRASS